MCNVNCIKWGAKNLTTEDVRGKRVIEVGSYDVNGSLRYIVELLGPAEYIGVDIMKGPGVDIICPAENLVERFGKESFDVVISTCVLEHVRRWKESVSNLKNICKPDGIILIIAPSHWTFHEFPYDFWRYKKKDMENIFSDFDILAIEEDSHLPSLVYVKIKKPEKFTEKDLSDYKLYSVVCNKRKSEINDKDLKTFYFKYLFIKNKIKNILLAIGRIIFQ